jgi:hypothetical protein
MAEEKQVAHINGRYAIIIALISLIGGYCLKEPVDRLFKPHCNIGGLWVHKDGPTCSINKIGDEFYINMQYNPALFVDCILSGKGEASSQNGKFEGTLRVDTEKKDTTITAHGVVNLQGCDGLGVTFFINQDESKPATFNFVREKSKNSVNPDESDKSQ